MYKRPLHHTIIKRITEERAFIQVLTGPRQVGKTTLAHQIKNDLSISSHYATADESALHGLLWIEQQWEIARLKAKQSSDGIGALLILDEIQKIPNWSNVVKKLWDFDTSKRINLKVMILGSSKLLIHAGLAENLGGRFELIHVVHWSFQECRDAFGLALEQYIYFGGYPGSIKLIKDEIRWSQYIMESIIETSLSRDVMVMSRIHKPLLLRRIFELGCHYSGDVISYQQMIGQLQEVGNIQTVAQYLDLLSKAGFVSGLPKYSGEEFRQKASSPKLQVLNTALISVLSNLTFQKAKQRPHVWYRLVESTIGAHLLNRTYGTKIKIYYWKEGNKEVDFVLQQGDQLVALEIKSSRKEFIRPGMEAFCLKFQPSKKLIIGEGGMPIEDFLITHPEDLF